MEQIWDTQFLLGVVWMGWTWLKAQDWAHSHNLTAAVPRSIQFSEVFLKCNIILNVPLQVFYDICYICFKSFSIRLICYHLPVPCSTLCRQFWFSAIIIFINFYSQIHWFFQYFPIFKKSDHWLIVLKPTWGKWDKSSVFQKDCSNL